MEPPRAYTAPPRLSDPSRNTSQTLTGQPPVHSEKLHSINEAHRAPFPLVYEENHDESVFLRKLVKKPANAIGGSNHLASAQALRTVEKYFPDADRSKLPTPKIL